MRLAEGLDQTGSGTDHRPRSDVRSASVARRAPPTDIYGAALFQVTGQQLSVAATRRTIGRIAMLFDGHLPSPAELLAVEPIQLRAAGLSRRKVDTLRDLAERLSDAG